MDDLAIDGVGAFVDTEGSSEKELGREDIPDYGDQTTPDELRDAVEERLEGILFGKQPQKKSFSLETGSLDTESEGEVSNDAWWYQV